LKAVADRILYLHEMKETISYDDIQRVIMNTTIKYRNTVKRRDSLPD
jgi:hypothetical protein